MAIIALSGYAQSGKDEVAKIIQNLTKVDDGALSLKNVWEIKKFSGKLKEIASILTGIPKEKFEDQEFKKSMLGAEWMTHGLDYDQMIGWTKPMFVRDFLQLLGTNAIRDNLHKNAWVNALMSDYTEQNNWIITDCRFPNEYIAVKKQGGITIRINREGIKLVNNHPSEVALDNYEFDYTIENNGSLEDLENHIKQHILPNL